MQTLEFDVDGMHCGGCVSRVQRALAALDGVGEVEVTLHPGAVSVQSDASRVTAVQIAGALAALGFTATTRRSAQPMRATP
jgi:copper chaperone CopZ